MPFPEAWVKKVKCMEKYDRKKKGVWQGVERVVLGRNLGKTVEVFD